ncbi:MAG: MerR family transcriptional regulator [Mariprofundaceae bacterium]|nr:MerR family transcriptional regulator [Mariprofundaceae bacterium]
MVNELAKHCGVTPETVRYYVRVGLLHPRHHPGNNYKLFEADDARKLRFIKQAKLLGYTLSEISQILHHSRYGDSPCPLVRDFIQRRIEANRSKLMNLAALQKRMEAALKEWENKPDGLPDGNSICHLIESFAEEP